MNKVRFWLIIMVIILVSFFAFLLFDDENSECTKYQTKCYRVVDAFFGGRTESYCENDRWDYEVTRCVEKIHFWEASE